MPASLATALVLLAVEIFRAYRAKRDKRQDDHDEPDESTQRHWDNLRGNLGDGTRHD